MARYVLRRVPAAVVTLAVCSIAIFGCVRLLPGDPAAAFLGEDATPAAVAALHHRMGLDRPVAVQYLDWLGGLVTGRLGQSYVSGASVADLVGPGVVPTLQLAVAGMLVTVVVGLLLGTATAVARHRAVRAVLRAVGTVLYGTPEYIAAVVGVLVFAVALNLLPAGGRVPLTRDPEIAVQYFVLPAIGLGLHSGAVVARFLESALTRTLAEDFVTAARAKGISVLRLLGRHALPNAVPTVLVVLGLRLGHLLGGAVVIEAVFTWHGLGQVLVNAVNSRDYRIVQDLVLYSVAVFVAVQLVTDLAHAALDPRVRETALRGEG